MTEQKIKASVSISTLNVRFELKCKSQVMVEEKITK